MGVMLSVVRFLYTRKWLGLCVIILCCALAGNGIKYLKTDFSVTRMIVSSLADYNESLIKNDNKMFVIVKSKQHNIFSKSYLQALSRLVSDMKKLKLEKNSPKVIHVHSILSAKTLENTSDGLIMQPLIASKNLTTKDIILLKNRIARSKYIKDNLITKDYKSSALLVEFDPKREMKVNNEFSDKMESLLHKYRDFFASYHYMSVHRVNSHGFRATTEDMLVAGIAALCVMMVLVMVMTRRVKAVCICLATIICNLIISMGLIGYSGFAITNLTGAIPVIILVIGSTESIHIVCSYLKAICHAGISPVEAMMVVVRKVYFSTMMTTLTTSIGFLGFAFSSKYAIREFGYEGAIAMAVCGFVALIFLPTILALVSMKPNKNKAEGQKNVTKKSSIEIILSKWVDIVVIHSGSLIVCFIIIFSGAAYFASQVKVDMPMLDVFSANHPVSQSLAAVRSSFGGTAIMKLKIKSKNLDAFIVADNLKKLRSFTQRLEHERDISAVASIADVFVAINGKLHGDDKHFTIPNSDDAIEQLASTFDVNQVSGLVNSDFNEATINLRVYLHGQEKATILQKRIKSLFKKSFNNDFMLSIDFRYNYHFLALRTVLSEGMMSLLGCLALIFIMFCLQFVNIRSGLLAVVANLFSVVLLLAFMSLCGFTISPSSMCVLIIVLSVGVDDTIHFFTKFAMFSKSNDTLQGSLLETLKYEFLPITATSVAIALAMLCLLYNRVILFQEMGLLLSVGMLFAYISDMLICPVLLARYRIISLLDVVSFKYSQDSLQQSRVFLGMSKSEIKKVILLSYIRHYRKGEKILKEGSSCNHMYILLEGEVDVKSGSQLLATLGIGEVVGEVGYFSDELRTADVFAKTDVTLVVLDDATLCNNMKFYRTAFLKFNRNAVGLIAKRLSAS